MALELNDLPKPGDTEFADSPDAGDEKCLCSRCGQKIEEWQTPIRLFDKERNTEFRYHLDCIGGRDRTKQEYDDECDEFYENLSY